MAIVQSISVLNFTLDHLFVYSIEMYLNFPWPYESTAIKGAFSCARNWCILGKQIKSPLQ